MSFLNTVKKHLVGSVAILAGAVAVVVAGVSWISYTTKYNETTAKIQKDREALNAKLPKLPEEVFIDDDYFSYDDSDKTVASSKSAFKNSYVYEAEDAEITLNDKNSPASYTPVEGTNWNAITGLQKKGGTVTFAINTSSYGKSDIDIVLASTWKDSKNEMHAVGNVSDFIKIEINGLLVRTEDAELPEDGSYQHLILKNTHLMEGENTLKIKSAVYNDLGGTDIYVMPSIRNIAVMTDVNISMATAE